MSTQGLQEYRCRCGKLLFKGLLFACAVEIKCKRCGAMFLVEQFEPRTFAFLESDARFVIITTSGDTETVFRYESKRLLGRSLHEFFPLLKDNKAIQKPSHPSKRPYEIHSETLMLKDGGSHVLKGYRFPKQAKNGAISGYRVIGWISRL